MNDQAREYARLSELAYLPPKKQSAGAKQLGWDIDPDLSDRNRTVFVHPGSKKAVLAFRGTDPKNVKDLASDALIAAGLQGISPRFRTSEKVAKAALIKYPNLVATGHSLGGSQALHVNRKLGLESHAFSPGAGFADQRRGATETLACKIAPGMRRCQNAKRSTVYATAADPIAVNATFGADRKVMVRPKRANPHTVRNFSR